MALRLNRRDILVGTAASAAVLTSSTRGSFAAGQKIHNIQINSFKFEPKHIVVKVGDIVRWTNEDLAPHTATANEAGWDTGEIVKGQTKTIMVFDGMETNYFCAFHPHMRGTIELA